MTGVRLAPLARRDLDEIWDYTVATWGEAQAERYLRDIAAGFDRIAATPERGRDRSVFLDGLRSIPVKRHEVFWIVPPEGPVVLRIVHQRRNWAALVYADRLG